MFTLPAPGRLFVRLWNAVGEQRGYHVRCIENFFKAVGESVRMMLLMMESGWRCSDSAGAEDRRRRGWREGEPAEEARFWQR